MRFISLCDGIGAAYEAWTPLGWTCAARAEIEPFPLAVTAARQPGPAELGDVTKITEDQIALLGPVDLIIFGSPCQDLSVAGKRKGLAGERSGLFHDCMRVALWARDHCGARWVVWENVPGAFSSHKGRDFAVVVGAMAGCGDVDVPAHGWGTEGCAVGDHGMVEWAVLDAQWFGLAQRRKRVFALLDLGDWARRPPILLERQGLRGNSPPRRAQGQGAAGTLEARTRGGGFPGTDGATSGHVVPVGQFGPVVIKGAAIGRQPQNGPQRGEALDDGTCYTLNTIDQHAVAYSIMPQNSGKDYKARAVDVAQPLLAAGPGSSGAQGGDVIAFALRGRDEGAQPEVHGQGDAAGALRAAPGGSTRDYVAFALGSHAGAADGDQTNRSHANGGPVGSNISEELAYSLRSARQQTVAFGYAVRRLTPTECHKLQGFKTGHCAVTYRGKPAADGPIYKALGNSMAVPVIRWIGEQIMIAELF